MREATMELPVRPLEGATLWEVETATGPVLCRRVECWDRSHEPTYRLAYRGGQICLDPVDALQADLFGGGT